MKLFLFYVVLLFIYPMYYVFRPVLNMRSFLHQKGLKFISYNHNSIFISLVCIIYKQKSHSQKFREWPQNAMWDIKSPKMLYSLLTLMVQPIARVTVGAGVLPAKSALIALARYLSLTSFALRGLSSIPPI